MVALKTSTSYLARLHHACAVATGLISFWLYLETLSPTVTFFDSGELIAAAYTLGVAHPPGYPLYVLIGWLFTKIPVGGVAYRLNLLSAVCGAGSAVMVYFIVTAILLPPGPSRIPRTNEKLSTDAADTQRTVILLVAMAAALAFASSRTIWEQSIIAEVYTLNAFLCGLIVSLLLHWRRACLEAAPSNGDKHAGRLFLVALVFGLGFGNHQTIALLSVAACFLVLATTPRLPLQGKSVLLILVGLGLGLSIYLLIPLRAAANPPMNWGNAVTWRQMKWLVMREGYRHDPHGHSLKMLWDDIWGRAPGPTTAPAHQPMPAPVLPEASGWHRISQTIAHSLFLRQLKSFDPIREFSSWGAALAALGMIYALIHSPVAGTALLLAVGSLMPITILISDPPPERVFLLEQFHTPSYLIVAAWIGIGLCALAKLCLRIAGRDQRVRPACIVLLAVLALALPSRQIARNKGTVDRHDNYVAYDYGTNILGSLKPGAILFTRGDSGSYPLWYLQIAEGLRPDVTLIYEPHLGVDWYVASLPRALFSSRDPLHEYQGDVFKIIDDIIQKQYATRPIYFDYSFFHSITVPYDTLPHGLVYKLLTPSDTLDTTVWDAYRFRGLLGDERKSLARDPDIDRVFRIYATALAETGYFYLAHHQPDRAAHAFDRAVQFDASIRTDIARKLGPQQQLLPPQPADSTNLP